jgi:hypothetical protein
MADGGSCECHLWVDFGRSLQCVVMLQCDRLKWATSRRPRLRPLARKANTKGMLFHFCFDFARFLMITLVLRPPNKTVERTRIRVGCVPRQSARADQHGREVAGT